MKRKYLALGFALAAMVLAAVVAGQAARTVRPLSRADCLVLEEHLQRQGWRLRVESGVLEQAAGEVVAVLTVWPQGAAQPVAMSYNLGPLDNREVLAGRFPR
jgi:hypothetical protein